MPRETFEGRVQQLKDDVLALGDMVERALTDSVETLKAHDADAARRLIAGDGAINEKRFAIENETLTVIATQQPVASDLRTLAAILEITTELERMGDYAKGIAKITLKIGDEPFIKPLIDIPRMAAKARDMIHKSLSAFIERDADMALGIVPQDDELDDLYNQVYRELLTFMMADPRTIDQASYLLWVAHNLERTGDRVVNICERVVFTVTGEMIEMDGDEEALSGMN
jgi:phosphate transport system protein